MDLVCCFFHGFSNRSMIQFRIKRLLFSEQIDVRIMRLSLSEQSHKLTVRQLVG